MTDSTSPFRIDKIYDDGAGHWIALTRAPGTRQGSLDADLEHLESLGTNVSVPLLTFDDMERLRIPDYPERCSNAILEVRPLSIIDGQVPMSTEVVARLCSNIQADVIHGIKDGLHSETEPRVVIHCLGGLGRSGTIGACALLYLGHADSPQEAIATVRKARPGAIETAGQEAFVEQFFADLRADALLKERTVAGRIRDALYGLALGDALGAPYEFMDAAAIKQEFGVPRVMRAGRGWECGELTDDTDLTLCTAEAYRPDGTFEPQAAADAMVRWLQGGPKDVGNLTRRALGFIVKDRANWERAGEMALQKMPNAAGNGSLMRCSPTALARKPDDPRLVEETRILSRITHADLRCVNACIAYNALLSSAVHRGDGAYDVEELLDLVKSLEGDTEKLVEIIEMSEVRQMWSPLPAGIGYALNAFQIALRVSGEVRSLDEGLIRAVSMGGDTDTNAAITGALLGAEYGTVNAPADWMEHLQRMPELDDVAARLARVCAG